MSGNFHTSKYTKENEEMINHKIKSILRKIHKLKRENLVLGDHRKSILRYKSRHNNSSIHTYNECELRFHN